MMKTLILGLTLAAVCAPALAHADSDSFRPGIPI